MQTLQLFTRFRAVLIGMLLILGSVPASAAPAPLPKVRPTDPPFVGTWYGKHGEDEIILKITRSCSKDQTPTYKFSLQAPFVVASRTTHFYGQWNPGARWSLDEKGVLDEGYDDSGNPQLTTLYTFDSGTTYSQTGAELTLNFNFVFDIHQNPEENGGVLMEGTVVFTKVRAEISQDLYDGEEQFYISTDGNTECETAPVANDDTSSL